MGMTIEEAKKLDHFLCSDCSADDDTKRSLNAFPVSPSEVKVRYLYFHLSHAWLQLKFVCYIILFVETYVFTFHGHAFGETS